MNNNHNQLLTNNIKIHKITLIPIIIWNMTFSYKINWLILMDQKSLQKIMKQQDF